MKTAVIYARYSSDRQTEQSIEGQLHVCQDYAQRNNIVIVDNYIDRAMSGTTDNRPAFKQMLKDSAKKQWDYVIVYKLDRFSRNKYENAIHKKTLKDNGVKLLSAMENIPESPEGIILESILEGMNQYYSLELAQKVSRGLRESRAKGQFTGGTPPYGYYVKDKKVYIKEDEAEIVKQIFNKILEGKQMVKVAEELNKQGHTHRGNPFTDSCINWISSNKRYKGIVECKGEIYTNIFPAIVSEEMFDRANILKQGNKLGKNSLTTDFMLRGKLFCGYCGKTICGESGTSHTGNKRYYYKCLSKKQNTKNCKKKTMRKDDLEKFVTDITMTVLNTPSNKEFVIDKITEVLERKRDSFEALERLKRQREKIKFETDNIVATISQGITNKAILGKLDELEKQADDLDVQILIEENKRLDVIERGKIEKFLNEYVKKPPKQMLQTLIQKAVLFDDRIEITYNFTTNPDPDEPETERRDFLLPFTIGNESIIQGNGYIVLSVTNKDFTVYYGNIEYRLTDLIRYAYEQ